MKKVCSKLFHEIISNQKQLRIFSTKTLSLSLFYLFIISSTDIVPGLCV